jgi:hypothetical protein
MMKIKSDALTERMKTYLILVLENAFNLFYNKIYLGFNFLVAISLAGTYPKNVKFLNFEYAAMHAVMFLGLKIVA